MFRRRPQPERRIVYTVIYYDPLADQRLQVTRDLLNGKEIDEDDPRLKAFNDPYWTGSDYKPPEQKTSAESSSGNYGVRNANYQSPPSDPFRDDPLAAANVPLYRLLGLEQDPLEAAQAEMDTLLDEADAMYREAEEMYRMAEADLRASIPPHARILFSGYSIEERVR